MKNSLGRTFVISAMGLFLLTTKPGVATEHAQAAQQQGAVQKPDRPASGATGEASRGEKVFKQNCSRCHEAPQGFSSRISGTILRHMRVRASLSEQDEREVLRFLNP